MFPHPEVFDLDQFKAVAYCTKIRCYITAKTYNGNGCLASCYNAYYFNLPDAILKILTQNRKV